MIVNRFAGMLAAGAVMLGAASAPKTHVHACQSLKFEDDMLDDVAHVSAIPHPLKKAARPPLGAAVLPKGGYGLDQPLGEAGQLVGGELLVLAYVGQDLQHGPVRPDVGPAERGAITDASAARQLQENRIGQCNAVNLPAG